MIARCIATNADLANHFRYLSGLLLGIGIAFPLIALNIETRAREFRMLGLIVIAGVWRARSDSPGMGSPAGRTNWRW